MAQMMIDGARSVLRAAQAKSPDKVLEAGEAVNVSCDTCHQRYQRGS
jgi:cytochrome c556